jgi:homoserine kinase type II
MAVYTEVSDDELARFIAAHGLGRLKSYKGIAEGVENTNFLVETSSGRFILTLYERRVAAADLPFFLGLMEHLAAAGIRCPTPVRDQQGHYVCQLAGRPAAIVTFLDGVWIRNPQPDHCTKVGAALARLHAAARTFPGERANALGPYGWGPLFDTFEARADEVHAGLRQLLRSEIDALVPAWPPGLHQGVIHADMFPDNVFFLDDELTGIIDFYFACNDALAYDIGICLNAWCFTPQLTFDRDRGRALLAGYQSVRPLEPAERDALPMLARGAALRFLLTRAHDWLETPKTALVKPHDPLEYLKRLEFHRSVTSPLAYGLEP